MDESIRPIMRALRRLLHRRGWTITEGAKRVGIERSRFSKGLALKVEFTPKEWRQIWSRLDLWLPLNQAIVRLIDALPVVALAWVVEGR